MNGAYGAAGTSGAGSMVAMSPESLVALCAMQLQKFDGDILDRMAEKDKNMALQEKLAGLTSKLEAVKGGLTTQLVAERRAIVDEMKGVLSLIKGDPTKAELERNLQAQLTALEHGKNENPGLQETFRTAHDKTTAAGSKLSDEQKSLAESRLNEFINWETGDVNLNDGNSAGLTPEQKDYITSRGAEHKAYMAAEKAAVGDGQMSAESVSSLLEYTKSAGAALSSRNDTIMMELQSLVSQRSTSIQMTSNLSNSLLEATKSIAANIGR